jgi:hypothetical protein
VKELTARASVHGGSLHASAYRGYRKDPPVPGIEAFFSGLLRSHQGPECKSSERTHRPRDIAEHRVQVDAHFDSSAAILVDNPKVENFTTTDGFLIID